LADEIRDAFGVESELVEGTRGIFDVYVDDRLVFSKHAKQRFPEPGEVVNLIREVRPVRP
jgi:selT/selW/selH-like putative selenoprotein